MQIETSIIIPVFNKSAFTLSCLKDLFHLDQNTTEIIVIDNASTDNTQQELLIIERNNFHYIRNDQNIFHSAACNIGFRKSIGNTVIFLNNDIRILNNHNMWINALSNNNDLVGITMGQLDNNFNFIQEAKKELSGNSYLSGWFVAASRKNWDNIAKHNNEQIWDERLPFYFNDGDLSFRAKKLGLKLKILPIPIVHFGKISASQQNISKLYGDGRKVFSELWKYKI